MKKKLLILVFCLFLVGCEATPAQVSEPLPTIEPTPEPTPEPTQKPKPTPYPIKFPDDSEGTIVNGLMIVGNRAMEQYSYSSKTGENYASVVNNIAEKVGVDFYSVLFPTSAQFYATKKYHGGTYDQDVAISDIYSKMSDKVKTVDAYTYIAAHANEALYFRTDHHWTQRAAYYAYVGFCEAIGEEPIALEDFEKKTTENFVGSMKGFTKNHPSIVNNPEDVEIFMPKYESESYAYTSTAMTDKRKIEVINLNMKGSNSYLTFMSGDSPLIHTVTENKNGKKVLVTKDSFGNAFIPFLVNHYEEIYVVDPREIKVDYASFIAEKGIDQMVMANYLFALSNQKMLNGLK